MTKEAIRKCALVLALTAARQAAAQQPTSPIPVPVQEPLQLPRQPRPGDTIYQVPASRYNPPYHLPLTVYPEQDGKPSPPRVATLPRPVRPSHRHAHKKRRSKP